MYHYCIMSSLESNTRADRHTAPVLRVKCAPRNALRWPLRLLVCSSYAKPGARGCVAAQPKRDLARCSLAVLIVRVGEQGPSQHRGLHHYGEPHYSCSLCSFVCPLALREAWKEPTNEDEARLEWGGGWNWEWESSEWYKIPMLSSQLRMMKLNQSRYSKRPQRARRHPWHPSRTVVWNPADLCTYMKRRGRRQMSSLWLTSRWEKQGTLSKPQQDRKASSQIFNSWKGTCSFHTDATITSVPLAAGRNRVESPAGNAVAFFFYGFSKSETHTYMCTYACVLLLYIGEVWKTASVLETAAK